MQPASKSPPVVIDPGWLFLLAGLGLLAATVLVPAAEDRARAAWHRDRALAVEAHRQARLDRYQEYLSALEAGEPSLVLALAEKQLNQIPADRALVPGERSTANDGASVFVSLEPPPLVLPEYTAGDSMLARWTRGGMSRVLLLAGGAICVLLGLLPASRPGHEPEAVHGV